MDANAVFFLAVAAAGFCLSILIEKLIIPRVEPFGGAPRWLLHFGILNLAYCAFVFICGRPIFAMAVLLAFFLILVFVNNAKWKSMREPFLFQDYDYFLDTIRFPRLFLPFLGLKNFIICLLACALAAFGFFYEQPPPDRLDLHGQGGALLILSAASLLALIMGARRQKPVIFKPATDLAKLGLPGFLWAYGSRYRQKPRIVSPFKTRTASPLKLPHLLALQSESFFDARELFDGIRPDPYENLDKLASESLAHGKLVVPAWGANTIRTESAFLTGLAPASLGVHQFSPYQAMCRGWHPGSLATFLRAIGYRTICVHPYYKAFYGRDKIFPLLGFDEFVDIRQFSASERVGAYIGDMALGEKIISIMKESHEPVFIFAISMENHGPLHLEQAPESALLKSFYRRQPPPGCRDLGVFLRHASNTSKMLGRLAISLRNMGRPVSFCFYGDHVPIMADCYAALGEPEGVTPFFCWTTWKMEKTAPVELNAENLAQSWLRSIDSMAGFA